MVGAIRNKFEPYVDGFTSDHTYVTAKISTYGEGAHDREITVVGLTWNLLNQCNPHNNPFGVQESGENYVLRKVKQFEFLIEQMQSGIFDFIVLQEVDIFTQTPMPEFVKKFLGKAREFGWLNTHSEAVDNVRMPLLTFYNTKNLEFVSKKPIFPVPETQKNCGLEATFNYAKSDIPVCITNIHLEYNIDFGSMILKYQKQQIGAGKFTIIAGDTNNDPKIGCPSLVGDLVNRPTNIDPQFKLRLLDGFMAGPAALDQRVAIMEGPLVANFEWVSKNLLSKLFMPRNDGDGSMGKFICNEKELMLGERLLHGYHVSKEGEPWIAPSKQYLLYQTKTTMQQHPHE